VEGPGTDAREDDNRHAPGHAGSQEERLSRAKEAAGRRAAQYVQEGMTVGLGTGSTVHFTLLALAERVQRAGLHLKGVPTSLDTEAKSRELGIPLVSLAEVRSIDVTIDGADEIDPSFQMIKGGGGALLREKVVATLTRCEVIVVDTRKVVERLGLSFLLPVEIVPFARSTAERALRMLGATPTLRRRGGVPFVTDNGNELLDCQFPEGISDPAGLERRLAVIPGVVESGLFVDLAHVLVIGHEDGRTEVRERG
jgi:ribose 5-phosphate isomerase A